MSNITETLIIVNPTIISILEALTARPEGMTTGQVLGQVLDEHAGTTRVEVWNTLVRLSQRDLINEITDNVWQLNRAKFI